MKTTYKILRDARNLLQDPDRWIKNFYTLHNDKKTRYCIVGAVEQAMTDQGIHPFSNQRDSALQKIAIAINVPVISLEGWNDAPDITHKHVVAALSKGMRLAR